MMKAFAVAQVMRARGNQWEAGDTGIACVVCNKKLRSYYIR